MRFDDIRVVVFDLDGTLVDSLTGIEASLRHAFGIVAPQMGTVDLQALLRAKVGPPLPVMMSDLWPDMSEEVSRSVLGEFRAHYNREGCLCGEVFPGVPSLLGRLHASGRRLFVLTNKPKAPTLTILHHLGLEHLFEGIYSPDSSDLLFSNKDEGALLLKQRHALEAGKTLLVGDSPDDLKAADIAGFHFAEASYGYGFRNGIVTQSDRIRLKSPDDLSRLFFQDSFMP